MTSPTRLPVPTPFVSQPRHVVPEWVDENGHMNIAPYLSVFDHAFYDVYAFWGMDFDKVEERGYSTFVAESHMTYQSELRLGEAFTIETRLMEFDEKRIRWFQYMKKADGRVAASCELLNLFMDIRQRRVVAIPPVYSRQLNDILLAHKQLPEPVEAGRCISMPAARRQPKTD